MSRRRSALGRFVRLAVAGALVGGLVTPGAAVAESPPAAPAPLAWQDLGTLGGSWSTPTDVNDAGQVVGTSVTADGRVRAFRWQRGVLTDLGALSVNSEAAAINERGDVVGGSDDRPVRWRNGVLTDLVAVQGPGRAADINDRGEVIGIRYTPTSGMYGQGFLWRDGRSVDLPGLGGDTYPVAMNNRGEAVGFGTTDTTSEAVLWRNGRLIRLAPPTALASMAHDINERGQVLGSMRVDDSTWHGFLWQDGVRTDLGPVSAVGINNRGEVAANPDATLGGRPVRWHRGVATELVPLDGRSGQAFAINSAGSVAGQSNTTEQETHGVVWSRDRVIDLGPLRYGISIGGVHLINDRGLVVGVLNPTGDGYRAVVWDTARR
ncbi:hypothetical protein AB0C04_28355 [Micromonospora sp. NPDC048909]|uniref:hypothetical protein n=1 Tax=Micromonospora sp. NPDC048909 TaxID=3155643 RepID=UPI0033F3A4B1